VPDYEGKSFASHAQIHEMYAECTLIKFACIRQRVGREGSAREIPEGCEKPVLDHYS
jgi:hypothetical protein